MRGLLPLGVVLVAWVADPTWAIMGCLTPERELATRSDVVAVGTIDRIDSIALDPCFDDEAQVGRMYGRDYPRCGTVLRFAVTVTTLLRGDSERSISVLVPRGILGGLACDDRPPPEKMLGLEAVLFLEKQDATYWAVDGPDGIYCSRSHYGDDALERLRALLVQAPRHQGKE